MNKPPLFSIITVTYNAEKTLERTILSIVNQTYLYIEYIVVDGNSSDHTQDIIKQYESAISHRVSEPDAGLYDAMNKGLQRATGDYVWFLNAGDVIPTSATVEQISASLSALPRPASIVYGETDIVNSAGNFIAHRRLKAPATLTWKSFRMGMLVSHQSFIVQREMAPLFDLRYRFSADFDWCIRCLKAASYAHNSHLILSNYLHEGLTTAHRKASLKERFYIMVRYYGWLPTVLRHLWFFVRFYTSKILRRQL
jgi:glycosyltransferase involved in cell wall biosynthesis